MKKKQYKMDDFISAKFVMDFPCVRPYILFYIDGPAILHFFRYVNITKLQKFKMADKRLLWNCLHSKFNQGIG